MGEAECRVFQRCESSLEPGVPATGPSDCGHDNDIQSTFPVYDKWAVVSRWQLRNRHQLPTPIADRNGGLERLPTGTAEPPRTHSASAVSTGAPVWTNPRVQTGENHVLTGDYDSPPPASGRNRQRE